MKFSILIPTFNHLEDLLIPCLDSIKANTDLSDTEVLVMANGCTDGTEDYVRKLGEPFRVISYPLPLGYTKAMNVAIAAAEGEFVIPCNNDIRILDWGNKIWIQMLHAPFSDPKVGITGPFKQFRAGKPFIVFCLTMIRRSLFGEVGYLDEAFSPGAGEDTDWCLKIQKNGYKVIKVPNDNDPAELSGNFPMWHVGGQTVNTLPDWGQVIQRNEKILQQRYGMGGKE